MGEKKYRQCSDFKITRDFLKQLCKNVRFSEKLGVHNSSVPTEFHTDFDGIKSKLMQKLHYL